MFYQNYKKLLIFTLLLLSTVSVGAWTPDEGRIVTENGFIDYGDALQFLRNNADNNGYEWVTASGEITDITDTQIANWDDAYDKRVDTWTAPLVFSSNTASITTGTLAGTSPIVVTGGTNKLLTSNATVSVTTADLLGTANQVTVTGGTDKLLTSDVTLSLPQNIDTSADVTFDSVTADTTLIGGTPNTNWDDAYTHSQIEGGDSVHVSLTENAQWDSGYLYRLESASGIEPLTLTLADNALTGEIDPLYCDLLDESDRLQFELEGSIAEKLTNPDFTGNVDDWTLAGGASYGTNAIDFEIVETMTTVATSDDLGSSIYGVAVSGNYVYESDGDGYVKKLNTSDLAVVATSDDLGNLIYGVAISGDYVYASNNSGYVYKLNISDLSTVATSDDLGSNIYITISGDYVYSGSGNGYVYKLNISDLSTVATSDDLGSNIRSSAISGDYVYSGNGDGYVYKLNISDLSTVATSDDLGNLIYGVAVSGDYVYEVNFDNYVKKLNTSDLAVVATSDDLGSSIYGVAVSGNYVYESDGDGYVKKLNTSDLSTVATSDDLGSNIRSSAISGDYVYSGNGDGYVYKLNIGTTTLSQLITDMVTPIVEGNKYTLLFSISGYVKGSVDVSCGGVEIATLSADDDYSYTFVCIDDEEPLTFYSDEANEFTIDATSLKDLLKGRIITDYFVSNPDVEAFTWYHNDDDGYIENDTGILYISSDEGIDISDTVTIDSDLIAVDATFSGTVTLAGLTATANLDIGAYSLTALNFVSDVTTGTSPYACTSTTLNTNLNADLWDGYQFADYLNQALLTSSSPTFVDLTLTGDLDVTDTALIDGTLLLSTGSITDSSGTLDLGDTILADTIVASLITGTDVDLSLGTGDVLTTGTLGAGAITGTSLSTTGAIYGAEGVNATSPEMLADPNMDDEDAWEYSIWTWEATYGAYSGVFHYNSSSANYLRQLVPLTPEADADYLVTIYCEGTGNPLKVKLGGITKTTTYGVFGAYSWIIHTSSTAEFEIESYSGANVYVISASVRKIDDFVAYNATLYGTLSVNSIDIPGGVIIGSNIATSNEYLKLYGMVNITGDGFPSALEFWTGKRFIDSTSATHIKAAVIAPFGLTNGFVGAANYVLGFYDIKPATSATAAKIYIDPTTGDLGLFDNSSIFFGTGAEYTDYSTYDTWKHDAKITYTGTYWDFDILRATSAIRFNQSQIDTDFIVYGDTGAIMTLDAGDLSATFGAYVNAVGGFKDNGTAGIDTTFLDQDGNTITVSGGIITSKVAP